MAPLRPLRAHHCDLPQRTDARTMLDLLLLALGLGGFALMAIYVAACARV
jgi:hypothetical protein